MNMVSTLLFAKEFERAPQLDPRAGKYLVFQLANEEFGIRIVKVREIMGIQHITEVPQTPPHIKGVINLRGKVIPIVDLRLKFGVPAAEYTARTCIIVTQVTSQNSTILTGMAKVKAKVKILLDIDRILSAQDLHKLNAIFN
jgi:purine-binding chemotaxis protein CheW